MLKSRSVIHLNSVGLFNYAAILAELDAFVKEKFRESKLLA